MTRIYKPAFYTMHPLSAFFRPLRPLLVLFVLTLSLHGAAQTPPGGRLSQLENARIAYLTEKVSLTQEQAQQFWPVYNEYAAKRRDLNQRSRQLRTTRPETLSDQQLKDNLNQVLALRQQEVDLDKDYLRQFQKVLSIRQVSQLYAAERQFTREVLQRVTRSRRR
ncbi:Spy/CpxP family protein refolding chaperone [Hymenobacter aerilatus]|uniref:Spy/CpxP family protein refolding chaperone n=1 Tax=Hymenobacter aerilatus TaxID=2932251 RepID=A0A8T9T085_9BACT|nr:Spy/CpxP family protein refolding chaperone [Hymenobacter aerilatus]UOR06393.1 Spy/CpxP family protein refolding chaperone [Hymenobacter aerilatus]